MVASSRTAMARPVPNSLIDPVVLEQEAAEDEHHDQGGGGDDPGGGGEAVGHRACGCRRCGPTPP